MSRTKTIHLDAELHRQLKVASVLHNIPMEKIASENREGLTMNEFKDMFYQATAKPYSFLHINNQRQDPLERFHTTWHGCCHPHNKEGEKTPEQ